MGPQPLGHGYVEYAVKGSESALVFQWGHNLSVMDTVAKCTIS